MRPRVRSILTPSPLPSLVAPYLLPQLPYCTLARTPAAILAVTAQSHIIVLASSQGTSWLFPKFPSSFSEKPLNVSVPCDHLQLCNCIAWQKSLFMYDGTSLWRSFIFVEDLRRSFILPEAIDYHSFSKSFHCI